MKTNTNLSNFLIRATYVIVTILSIIFTWLSVQNNLINDDGILYLQTAQVYLDSGFINASKIFAWPFYPMAIALVSKTLDLQLVNSAYIINAVLQLGIIFAFLNLFRKFNPTNRQFIIAAVVITLFPQLNEYRSYIIRDFGYWAFSLAAVGYLINYAMLHNNPDLSKNKIIAILSYYCCFFIAFLFRTEALLLLLILPLALLIDYKNPYRYKMLGYIYAPAIIISVITLLGLLLFIDTNSLYIYLNYGAKLDVFRILSKTYQEKLTILNTDIFTITHNSFIGNLGFLWLGLIAVFINKFITVFNLLNFLFVLAFFKFFNKNNIDIKFRILFFAILINLLIPTGFLYLIFVTTGRYYCLSALLLLVIVPFGIDYVYQRVIASNYGFKHAQAMATGLIYLVIISVATLGSFNLFDNQKAFIKQAGVWYKHYNLPIDNAVANNLQLAYSAGLVNQPILNLDVTNLDKLPYAYVLLKIKHKDKMALKHLDNLVIQNKATILKQFKNHKNDIILILQTNNDHPSILV